MRDEASIVRRLTEEFGLGQAEAEAYIRALEEGYISASVGRVAEALRRRGMVIRSADSVIKQSRLCENSSVG